MPTHANRSFEEEAAHVLDGILAEFDAQPTISTKRVLSRFRQRMPRSPVAEHRLVEILVHKITTLQKAVQFDEHAPDADSGSER